MRRFHEVSNSDDNGHLYKVKGRNGTKRDSRKRLSHRHEPLEHASVEAPMAVTPVVYRPSESRPTLLATSVAPVPELRYKPSVGVVRGRTYHPAERQYNRTLKLINSFMH